MPEETTVDVPTETTEAPAEAIPETPAPSARYLLLVAWDDAATEDEVAAAQEWVRQSIAFINGTENDIPVAVRAFTVERL